MLILAEKSIPMLLRLALLYNLPKRFKVFLSFFVNFLLAFKQKERVKIPNISFLSGFFIECLLSASKKLVKCLQRYIGQASFIRLLLKHMSFPFIQYLPFHRGTSLPLINQQFYQIGSLFTNYFDFFLNNSY